MQLCSVKVNIVKIFFHLVRIKLKGKTYCFENLFQTSFANVRFWILRIQDLFHFQVTVVESYWENSFNSKYFPLEMISFVNVSKTSTRLVGSDVWCSYCTDVSLSGLLVNWYQYKWWPNLSSRLIRNKSTYLPKNYKCNEFLYLFQSL